VAMPDPLSVSTLEGGADARLRMDARTPADQCRL
jgi:hypothetical protein